MLHLSLHLVYGTDISTHIQITTMYFYTTYMLSNSQKKSKNTQYYQNIAHLPKPKFDQIQCDLL